MAFITINGIDVDVRVEEASRPDVIEIGEKSRAFDGTLRKSRQGVKRAYSIQTGFAQRSDSLALESLLLGLGHRWSFDSHLYSSKGLGPSSTTAAAQAASGNSKFGAGRLQVNATTGSISFATGFTSGYTFMVWRSTNGTTYSHHIIMSDGTKYVDGVSSVAATT